MHKIFEHRITTYNQFSKDKVNTDLQHITEKALSGIFTGREEEKRSKRSMARGD
jgi:hypothetical protein